MPVAVTFIVYHKQGSLQQTFVTQRRDLYSSLTNVLHDNAVDAMRLHVADHFDPKTYETRYPGNLQRIRSYLLTAYLNGKPTRFVRLRALGPVSFLATGKFLDVHAGLSKYHPEFASQVNRELEGRTTCRWALEPKANRIEGGESCRAVGTNHAHSLFSLPVIDGNGGATSRESVHRMPSAFAGWGGPRSDEKGDP